MFKNKYSASIFIKHRSIDELKKLDKEIFSNIIKTLYGLDLKEKNKGLVIYYKENYNNKYIKTKLKKCIKEMQEEFDLNQFKIFVEYSKNHPHDSTSIEFFKSKYGEKIYKQKYNQHIESIKSTLENYINKWGEEEGKRRYNEWYKKVSNKKESFLQKWGKKEGEKRWKLFCEKNKYNKSLNRMIELYGEINGKRKYEEVRYKDKYTKTLEYYKEKWGEEEGEKRWKEKNKKISYGNSSEAYKEKWGDLWKEKLRETKDNTSLQSFIKRYGKEEGEKRYNKYRKKLSYANSLEFFKKKYGELEGLQKYKIYIEKTRFTNGYSKISQEFFWKIYNSYKNNEEVYFGELNKEYHISDNGKIYLYDYVDLKNKFVIEYNGDIFHANPKMFNENDRPNPFNKNLTAKEIWDYDKRKLELLKYNGIDYMIVWESDYKNNPDKIINNIINKINSI